MPGRAAWATMPSPNMTPTILLLLFALVPVGVVTAQAIDYCSVACVSTANPNFGEGVGFQYYEPTCKTPGPAWCIGNISGCRLCTTNPTKYPAQPMCPPCIYTYYGLNPPSSSVSTSSSAVPSTTPSTTNPTTVTSSTTAPTTTTTTSTGTRTTTTVSPTTTSGTEKLVFSEEFSEFDLSRWKHEITAGGGGNWEFQYYDNNRASSYVKDGVLYIKPVLTTDVLKVPDLTRASINLWGSQPANQCTGNQWWGCERSGNPSTGAVVNPVLSARLRTAETFSFKYGRVEVRAQLPRGDWLWPALWMLPLDNQYGEWPASGEIDIMESRGNGANYAPGGNNRISSTLHWGPDYLSNRYQFTGASKSHPTGGSFADEFHVYGLEWTEKGLKTYLNTPSNPILTVNFTEKSFWTRGNFDPAKNINPWVGRGNAAPFDREFYLIMNLAVGGTGGYFPTGSGIPWDNSGGIASAQFWNARSQWLPTWQGESAALKVDWVRVWQL